MPGSKHPDRASIEIVLFHRLYEENGVVGEESMQKPLSKQRKCRSKYFYMVLKDSSGFCLWFLNIDVWFLKWFNLDVNFYRKWYRQVNNIQQFSYSLIILWFVKFLWVIKFQYFFLLRCETIFKIQQGVNITSNECKQKKENIYGF